MSLFLIADVNTKAALWPFLRLAFGFLGVAFFPLMELCSELYFGFFITLNAQLGKYKVKFKLQKKGLEAIWSESLSFLIIPYLQNFLNLHTKFYIKFGLSSPTVVSNWKSTKWLFWRRSISLILKCAVLLCMHKGNMLLGSSDLVNN